MKRIQLYIVSEHDEPHREVVTIQLYSNNINPVDVLNSINERYNENDSCCKAYYIS